VRSGGLKPSLSHRILANGFLHPDTEHSPTTS
jgi:hypothetical protein